MKYKARCEELEKELGRYKKRCDDLMKINRELGVKVEGARQLHALVNALQIQMALTYGERTPDPDTGEDEGWKLELPMYRAKDLLEKYEVYTWHDENGGYLTSVGLRKEPAGDA